MNSSGNKKSLGEIVIDLTPLLDVVFIMLVVVLTCFQSNYNLFLQNKSELDERFEEMEDQIEEANEQRGNADALISDHEIYENIGEYVVILDINETVNESDPSRRKIIIAHKGELNEFEINRNNMESKMEEIKNYILTFKSEDKPTVVKLQYEFMLYRDEEKITEILKDEDGLYVYGY